MLQIELGLWVTIICIYFMIWICVKKPEFTTKVKGVTSRKWFLMIMFTFGSLIGYWLYALYTVVTAELDKLKNSRFAVKYICCDIKLVHCKKFI